jgi:hypothetical protein
LKTLEVAIAFMAVMGIEDCRSSARGLVKGSAVVLAVSQLLGISVALPFLWVPSYLLLTRRRVEGAFLPAGKVGWGMRAGVPAVVHGGCSPRAARRPITSGEWGCAPCWSCRHERGCRR